jgi:two-component system OmpR family sensor kinase
MTPLRHRLAGWSLRARLLAVLIALLAVVCLVVGVVAVTALDSFLLGQLDRQLVQAAERSAGAFGGGPPPDEAGQGGPRGGPGFLDARGQGAGTLGAQVVDGEVDRAGVVGERGNDLAVPSSEWPELADLPADQVPRTRDLGGLGEYRLIAATTQSGDVIVTGLPLRDADAAVLRLAGVVALVAAIGLLIAGVAGAGIVRLTLRPLSRVADTATRVAELPLDRGEVALAERVPDTDPRTEVGRVGNAFNRMLGHVAGALAARQASETRVRQFVADASHELRTPLAAIRGYAELTRRTTEPVPPEIVHAMGRVESEATRMTTLVEELLLLARLDAGRQPGRDPVDLSRLLVDMLSDAHVAGPGHKWQLELPEEPVTVTGDLAQLHQVVANLLANARTHTPPGTTVTVGLTTAPGESVLTVADDGPGIPAELRPEVFVRFARGDASRSRGTGSTGLGLAIVAAVVQAHGGTVTVDSEPGRTVFTVRLPA